MHGSPYMPAHRLAALGIKIFKDLYTNISGLIKVIMTIKNKEKEPRNREF